MKCNTKKIIYTAAFALASSLSWGQTTINLAERCDCEITKHTSEVTAGATSPAGDTQGDMLIDPSGDLFYWDGDSWEYSNDGDWTVNGTSIYNNNSGNVGVGTTSIDRKFHVYENASSLVAKFESTTSSQSLIEFEDGTGVGAWLGSSNNNGAVNGITAGDFAIRTFNNRGIHLAANGGTSDLTIVGSNGNVGIGTTTPNASLQVDGRLNIGSGIISGSWSESSRRIFALPDGTSGGYIWSTIEPGNNQYNYYMHRHSTSGGYIAFGFGSNFRGSITSNGSSVSYNTNSDYRLKQNIAPLKGALEEIKKLRPSSYQFKDTPETTEAGFIAHELQEVYPQAVTGKKDDVDEEGKPKYQNVDYGKLTPLLTAGVQELRNLVDKQRQEIVLLKAELKAIKAKENTVASRLEERLSKLENLIGSEENLDTALNNVEKR